MIPRTTMAQADAVIKPLTLVEKLEQEVKRLGELKAQEKPHSLGYVFLGKLKSFVAWKPCRSRAGRNAILFN